LDTEEGYEVLTADGAIFQIIQVAVDTGIAQAAIDETVSFVRTKSRAWVDSGLDHAWEDRGFNRVDFTPG
jgi:alkylation response protein AidB-like acyl-CoA dehydrogenase